MGKKRNNKPILQTDFQEAEACPSPQEEYGDEDFAWTDYNTSHAKLPDIMFRGGGTWESLVAEEVKEEEDPFKSEDERKTKRAAKKEKRAKKDKVSEEGAEMKQEKAKGSKSTKNKNMYAEPKKPSAPKKTVSDEKYHQSDLFDVSVEPEVMIPADPDTVYSSVLQALSENKSTRLQNGHDETPGELENVFMCKVCWERYDLGDLKPLTLMCGHTFCERCVKAQLVGGMIKCPLD